MAEFTLNNDSKKALQLDDNGDVIAIESLTSELKKCAMQFLSILFSFGRYSYLPCPKEREPLNYALFLSYFFDFYSNEYCKDSCNHKHVNNLFEKYPDSFYVDFLTGNSVLKRLVISFPETGKKKFVLFASKKGAVSIERSKMATGMILNEEGCKELSFGSATIQFQDCTADLEKSLNLRSFFENDKLHITFIIKENDKYECVKKLSPERSIYEVIQKRNFSGFNNDFIKNVDEQYKKLIDKDSPKYNGVNKRFIEWKRKGKLEKKIKNIISEKINHIIL